MERYAIMPSLFALYYITTSVAISNKEESKGFLVEHLNKTKHRLCDGSGVTMGRLGAAGIREHLLGAENI